MRRLVYARVGSKVASSKEELGDLLLIYTDPAFFANMGRIGGQATGRKGFAAMPPEQVAAIRAKGLAVRRKRAALRRRNTAVADLS